MLMKVSSCLKFELFVIRYGLNIFLYLVFCFGVVFGYRVVGNKVF